MEPEPASHAVPPVLVACGSGCRHAEPLHGEYAEWVWCHRPAALHRVKRMGSDCRWFDAAEAIPPPLGR